MKFEEALQAMREGKKVKRQSAEDYLCIKSILCWNNNEGIQFTDAIIDDDMLAIDWEIVE